MGGARPLSPPVDLVDLSASISRWITPQQSMRAFDRLVREDSAASVVAAVDWPVFAEAVPQQPLELSREQNALPGLSASGWRPADGHHAGPASCSFELSEHVATSVREKSFPLNNNGSSSVLARA